MRTIKLNSTFDNTTLYINVYDVKNPKAIVQIVHGMMEHQLRYKEFAEFLNKNNYTVVTSDIRGHGHNITENELGYMGDKNQGKALVLDQITITNYINKNYPNQKVYLLGHSMGTMICRNIIHEYDYMYSKLVLSGAPAPQGIASIALGLTNLIGLFKGNHHKSNLLKELSIGPFIKSVKNYKTKNDWLSYNEENVMNYNNDPLCGFPFKISAYKGLFSILIGMSMKKKYKILNPNLPIYFLSGQDDPCTLGPKGLIKSIKILQKVGYNYISYKTYDNMRHEILLEKNKDVVYNDILKFYES